MTTAKTHATYVVQVVCSNCGVTSRASIRVGRRIRDHRCPTCGCKALARSIFANARREKG